MRALDTPVGVQVLSDQRCRAGQSPTAQKDFGRNHLWNTLFLHRDGVCLDESGQRQTHFCFPLCCHVESTSSDYGRIFCSRVSIEEKLRTHRAPTSAAESIAAFARGPVKLWCTVSEFPKERVVAFTTFVREAPVQPARQPAREV